MTQSLTTPLDRRVVAPVRVSSALTRLARARRQLLLYAVIGSLALVTDVGLFAGLTLVGEWSPLAAHTVSVPIAGVVSFALNASVNFRRTDRLAARMASFAVVSATGYTVGALVIWAIAEAGGLPSLLAKLMSLPLVFALQYRLNSRVTFCPTGLTR